VEVFRLGIGVKKTWFHSPSVVLPTISAALYLVSAFFQEFIIRGVFQSSLERFLVGKYRVYLAIIISNVMFMGYHQPLSWVFPLLVVIPGLFWGWLYFRHRTLIGVCISHLILGVWAFFIVGIGP
jgi:membrane protease YdiL (CAAX protease family)